MSPADPIRTTDRTFFVIGDGGKARLERFDEAKRYTFRIYCGTSLGVDAPCGGIMIPVFDVDGHITHLGCIDCAHRIDLLEWGDWNLEVLKDGETVQERREL